MPKDTTAIETTNANKVFDLPVKLDPGHVNTMAFSQDSISEMHLTANHALQITFNDGSKVQIENFQELVNSAQSCGKDTIIQLSDNTIIYPEELNAQLAKGPVTFGEKAADGSQLITLAEPPAGQIVEKSIQSGHEYKMGFNLDSTTSAAQAGHNLILTFKDGGILVMKDYFTAMNSELPPALTLADGSVVNSQALLASCKLAENPSFAQTVANESTANNTSTAAAKKGSDAAVIEPASGEETSAHHTASAHHAAAKKGDGAPDVEPAAGDANVANVEPAAGSAGGISGGHGYGFASEPSGVSLAGLNAIGAINATSLAYTAPDFQQFPVGPDTARAAAAEDSNPFGAASTEAVDESSTHSVTGQVVFNFGSDGPSTTVPPVQSTGAFQFGGSTNGTLTSHGNAVAVTSVGNTFTGTANGATVFTFTINSDGTYSFTQNAPLDHANGTDPNDVITLDFGVVGTDRDGDQALTSVSINVIDDAPVAANDSASVGSSPVTVLGNVLTNDSAGFDASAKVVAVSFNGTSVAVPTAGTTTVNGTFGSLKIAADGSFTYTSSNTALGTDKFTYTMKDYDGDTSSADLSVQVTDINTVPTVTSDTKAVDETNLSPTASITGAVTADYKADGAGKISANGAFTHGGSEKAGALTSGGVAVTVTQAGNVYTGKAGATTVFTLTIKDDGTYTFVLNKPLDHANASDPNDVINLHFGVISTDADGDKSTAGTININVNDDGPTAIADSISVTNIAQSVSGNVVTNDKFGNDGQPAHSVTKVTFGAQTVTLPTDHSNVTLTTTNGKLVINDTGAYTYTATNDKGGSDTFSYVIQDKDGDTDTSASTSTLTVKINDTDYTPTLSNDAKTVDETNLSPTTSITGKVVANYFSDGADTKGIVISGANTFSSSGSKTGGALTSGGVAVVVTADGNVYTGKAGAATVFTLTVNADGTYTFVLDKPLDHADKTNPDDIINLNFGVTTSDADGDKATGTITVSVKDDGPTAVADSISVTDISKSVSGNVVTNDKFGNDGQPTHSVMKVTFGAQTVTLPTDHSNVTLTTANGKLVINDTGAYTYTATTTTGGHDTFSYVIQDKDGDTDTAASTSTLTVTVNDIDYTPTVTNSTATVDETNLNPTTNVVGSVTANYFSDGKGAGVTGNGHFTVGGSEKAGALTSGGVAVAVTQAGNVYTGKAGADTVFTLTINTDGTYTFVLNKPLDHADATNPDDIINLHFGVTAADSDGDKSTEGTITINVKDDGPTAMADSITVTDTSKSVSGNVVTNDHFGNDGQPSHSVTKVTFGTQTITLPTDHSNVTLTTVNGKLVINDTGAYTYTATNDKGGSDTFSYVIQDKDGDTDTAASTSTLTVHINDVDYTPTVTNSTATVDETNMNPTTSVVGSVTANYFSDGKGAGVTGNGHFTNGGSEKAGALTSGGVAVAVTQTGNVYTGKAGADTVFTLTINNDGSYTFVLNKPLDHADATNPDDIINLHFGVTAADADGDKSTEGTITINVKDDGPTALADTGTVNPATHTVSGNVITNDKFGADGQPAHAVTKVTFGAQTVSLPTDHSNVTLTTANGKLVINDKGEYTYTATTTTGGSDVFSYTIQDKDGDTDTAATTSTLTITVNDIDYTPVVGSDTQTVDETNMNPTTSVVGSVTSNYFSDGKGTGVQGNGHFTAGGSEAAGKLTSSGVAVAVTQSGNVYTGKAGADTVFTLTINNDGSYTFVLNKPLDHADKTNPDDIINLHFGVTATDKDGDKSNEGTITINVKDDGPTAHADVVQVSPTTHTVSGNVVTNDDFGSDGKPGHSVTKVTFGTQTINLPTDHSNVTLTTVNGKLVINDTGAYTYTSTTTTGGKDVFTYVIQDKDGDTDTSASTSTLTVTVSDIDYTPTVTNSTVTVDETNMNPTTSAVGSVTANYFTDGKGTAGVSGNGHFTNDGSEKGGKLTSNGVAVTVTQVGNVYTGKAGADTVFTLTIKDDGTYTFVLNKPLDHANSSNPDDIINLHFGVTATDKDGDKSNEGTITINVKDDGPHAVADTVNVTDTSKAVTGNVTGNDNFGADGKPTHAVTKVTFDGITKTLPTDGSNVEFSTSHGKLVINDKGAYTYTATTTTGGSDTFSYVIQDKDGDTDTAATTATLTINVSDVDYTPTVTSSAVTVDETNLNPTTSAVGSVVANYFSDGKGTGVAFNGSFSAGGSEKGGALTSGGVAVVVTHAGNVYTGKAGADTVFTLTLKDDGTYTFVLDKPLDHADATNPDDVINLKFGVTATDADGDKSTAGTITINVKDDGPTAQADSIAVHDISKSVTGNVTGNDDFGSDGKPSHAVTKVTFGTQTVTLPTDHSNVTLTTANGKLVINDTGAYTYTATSNHGGTDTFSYVIQDKDGDTDTTASTSTLTVKIDDVDYTPTVTSDTKEIDETNMNPTTSVTGSVTANYFSDGPGKVSANGGFTHGGSEAGGKLTSGGVAVVVTQSGNVYTGKAGTETVFTLTLNSNGTYTFVLDKPLDHADKTNPDDIINLHFGVTATDADGDKATGTININVHDDGPHAVADTATVTDVSKPVTGNVTGNDNFGADGKPTHAVTKVTFGTQTVNLPTDHSNVTLTTPNGKLVINDTGAYTYTATSDKGGKDTFSYTIVDKDGDTDTSATTSTLTVTVTDKDYTPTLTSDAKTVDETNLSPTTSVAGKVAANYFTDGAGQNGITVSGASSFSSSGSKANNALTSGGVAVVVTAAGNVYTGKAGNDTVFTLTVNKDGSYTFVLDKPLDHADKTNPDDIINLNFGVTTSDADGDKANGAITISVKDDGPVANDDVNSYTIKSSTPGQLVTGNVVSGLNGGTGAADKLSHDGHNVVSKVSFNGVSHDVPATGTVSVEGAYGILKIAADGTYTYTVTSTGNVGPGNQITIADSFVYTLKDGDGDTDPAVLTLSGCGCEDHIPLISGDTKAVDETNLNPTTSVSGKVAVDYNGDGPGKLAATGKFTADGSEAAGKLTSGGVAVVVTQAGNVYTGKAGTATVFTLTINSDGTYNFVLNKPLDHADKTNPDDIINLHFGVGATDADGDTATNTITIQVHDDGPHAVADTATVAQGTTTATGNVIANDNFGKDGQPNQAVTKVTFAGTTYTVPATGALSVTGTYGKLSIDKDGHYTYTSFGKNGGGADQFTYTIADKDGDTDTAAAKATLTVTVTDKDDVPTVTNDTKLVDETNLNPTTSVAGKVAANYYTDGAGSNGIAGNGKFTADGSLTNSKLTSGGVAVVVTQVGNVYTGKAGSSTVFTLTINKDGSYNFVLDKPLDHADKSNPDDSIGLHFGFNAVDADGDKSNDGIITITVKDDGPIANDDTNSYSGGSVGSVISGNVVSGLHGGTGAADHLSKDNGNVVTKVMFNGTSYDVPSTGTVAVQGAHGVLKIGADGAYSYTISYVGDKPTINDAFTYVLKDADGDTDPAVLTLAGSNCVVDATPTITSDTKTIDETSMNPTAAVTGKVVPNYYTDGPGKVSANGGFTHGGSEAGGKLTSDGVAVLVTQSGNVYTGKAGTTTVFTLTVNSDGTYTYVQDKPLDHADKTNPDDIINLHFGVTATDVDGDKATGTININVHDDGPTISGDTKTVQEANIHPTTSVTGVVAYTYGADGAGALHANNLFTSDGSKLNGALTSGGVPVVVKLVGDTYTGTANGAEVFKLVLNPNGTYTFTESKILDHADKTDPHDVIGLHFGATVTDHDGDTASTAININVVDDGPSAVPTPSVVTCFNNYHTSDTIAYNGTAIVLTASADGIGQGKQALHLVLTGIGNGTFYTVDSAATYKVNTNVGTYDAKAGTWTLDLAPGENFDGHFYYKPASATDLHLSFIATVTEAGHSATHTDNYTLVVGDVDAAAHANLLAATSVDAVDTAHATTAASKVATNDNLSSYSGVVEHTDTTQSTVNSFVYKTTATDTTASTATVHTVTDTTHADSSVYAATSTTVSSDDLTHLQQHAV